MTSNYPTSDAIQRLNIMYQSSHNSEGEVEEQNSIHNGERETETNDNHNPVEDHPDHQDASVIEALQEKLRNYEELEVAFLTNERSLSQKIFDLEERKTHGKRYRILQTPPL